MNVIALAVCALVVCVSLLTPGVSAQDDGCDVRFPCITEINIAQYLGLWYQTYTNRIILGTIEPNATCVTANYAALDGDTLVVYNSNNLNNAGGQFDCIVGFAYVNPDPERMYCLSVDFPSLGNDTVEDCNYLIMELGPVVEGKYDYSLVSNPSKTSLFVLARDLARFESEHEAGVLAKLESWGFNNTLIEPIKTIHSSDCNYPASPRTVIRGATDFADDRACGPGKDTIF